MFFIHFSMISSDIPLGDPLLGTDIDLGDDGEIFIG